MCEKKWKEWNTVKSEVILRIILKSTAFWNVSNDTLKKQWNILFLGFIKIDSISIKTVIKKYPFLYLQN